jgi:hypothetical protein
MRNSLEVPDVVEFREYELFSKFAGVHLSYGQRLIMTISITLTPDQERRLEELAQQSGKDPANYVSDMVTAHLEGERAKSQKTFEEILAPVWEGWRKSGMAEEEIDDLFKSELEDLRRERRQSNNPT